ncbi:MAG: RdgB/HAM1 family non-canonical purine NTP pyrophosphatase [Acidimicrobiales bacterium]
MRAVVLATANPHKTEEIRQVLSAYDIELLPRPSDVPDVVENADTLEGNALLKANVLAVATGSPAIADDTGLFIDALDGAPGVFSARYAGEHASFDDNVRKVLLELEGVQGNDRSARFRTVIALANPDGTLWFVDGVLEGTILPGRTGQHGFGYDPIFAPAGANGRSLADLTPEEKNAISHRGIALRAFAEKFARS